MIYINNYNFQNLLFYGLINWKKSDGILTEKDSMVVLQEELEQKNQTLQILKVILHFI